MIIEKGDEGEHVKEIKHLLGMNPTPPVYDDNVEEKVRRFQEDNGLSVDGLVGPNTYSKLLNVTTDLSYHDVDPTKGTKGLIDKGIYLTEEGLRVYRRHMHDDQYVSEGETDKYYIFLHHTAGSEDPFSTVKYWNNDSRGRIGTQFCIGGIAMNGDDKFDGNVVEAFPNENYAWHLGDNGSHKMHKCSIGIELTNWGWLKEKSGKFYNYVDQEVPEDQVIELEEEFRGYKYYHKYTNEQLNSLKLLLRYLGREHDIVLGSGLPAYIWEKERINEVFDFIEDAYYGRMEGILTHTNVRKDKFDCSPQPELADLLLGFS